MQTAVSVRCSYCSAAPIRPTDLICKSCGHRVNTPLRTVLATIVLSALIMLALAVLTGVLAVFVEPVRFF